MRAAIVLALAVGCSAGRRAPDPGGGDRVVAVVIDGGVAVIDGGTVVAPAIDAAPVPATLPADAIASVLAREAGAESVLLVERRGAVVAITRSGTVVRELAAAPVRRARYDGRWIVWFHRGTELRAIDLGRPRLEEIVVIDAMPDLDVMFDDGASPYCPLGCVAIDGGVLGVVEPAEGPVTPAQRAAIERARTTAPPGLTADGRALLASRSRPRPAALPDRPEPPQVDRAIALSDATWPGPPSTRKRPSCRYADTCGHTFPVPSLSRSLLVVGGTCDCSLDACWATCVWFDPTAGLYATLRRPGRWAADAAVERACHPEFDITGTAYVIGGWISPGPTAICTAAACRGETGAFLGWLEAGFTTANVNEDLSTCPE